MAQENAEVFRRGIEAWNRRDIEGILDLAAPDIEYINSPDAVEPGTRHGSDEYGAVLQAQWDVIGDGQLEIQSLQTAGDDVYALMELSRTFGGGDTPLAQRIGTRTTIREGLIVRQEMMPVEQFHQALDAAGLAQ